ncbi:MAG: hypothetical protein ABSC17_03620 [Thermacetogeniaceae bacterium]
MADDQALDLFGETFVFELKEEFLNKIVNVEFCCGGHVKKAVGGRLVEVGRDFIELVAVEETLDVILFGNANEQFTEHVGKIIIPIDHICSVEDPCKKKKHEPCDDEAVEAE